VEAWWQLGVDCSWGGEGIPEVETVDLALEALDAFENLDKRLVFPRSLSADGLDEPGQVVAALGVLCGLRDTIVAFETELLAGATLWSLFITPLLSTPACIASLGIIRNPSRMGDALPTGRQGRAHLSRNGTSLLSETGTGCAQQGADGGRMSKR